MAYGTKIRIEYDDHYGLTNQIDIEERDYVGVITERTLDDNEPITPMWGDKSGDKLPLVYGSEAVLKLISEADKEFIYLFTADARKYRLTHKIEGVVSWTGFIDPENYGEPLTAPPYQVEATFTDGLGKLKDELFLDDTETAYTGRKTFIEIIQIILAKTGLQLQLNTAVNWIEESETAGTDPLKQHDVDVVIFNKFSCYEVLEAILSECRIFQRLGKWWVISNTNFENDTITYHNYAHNSYTETGTDTISLLASGYWIEKEPSFDMLSALKQLIVNQNFGYNANLVTNGDFTNYNDLLSQFETWTNHGVTPQQKDFDTDGNKYVYIPGKQYPDTFGNGGYGLINQYISKQVPVNETDSIGNISISYAEMGTKHSSLMFASIRLIGATNTYYLKRQDYVIYDYVNDATPEAEYIWVNINDKPNTGDDYITLGSHMEIAHQTGPAPDLYYNTYDNITAYPFDKIPDNFSTLKIKFTGIPESGQLEYDLYVPYTDRTEISGACYRDIRLELLDETAEKYPETTAFKVTNDLRNNLRPDDKTLIIGDYPDIPNYKIIYSGGIANAAGNPTTGWKISGAATFYTFTKFIALLDAAAQKSPRQHYKIRLANLLPTLAIIITDDGKRFVENGISFDARMQAIEGNYTELPNTDFSGLIVDEGTTFDTKTPAATSTGSGAAGQSKDERAVLVDIAGAKVSAPSYFDANYFTITILENGYSVIKPKYIQAGIITGLAAAHVQHEFDYLFDVPPVGRGSLHVYRTVEPEAGLILDQKVLWYGFAFTTNADGLIDGFELYIDAGESLAGIVIEYCFTKNMNI